MKRFFSFMMVVILVFSLSITAFAAPTRNDGSITITNPTAEQEYRLYKIFDANYATGTDGKVITNADGKAVVSYTIEKNNQFFSVMFGENGDQENNFFSYDAKTGVVKIKENYIESEVINHLGSLVGNANITPDQTKTAIAGDETVTFSGLATGYYLIDRGTKSTVTLTTNTPDVEIIDKNQQPNANDSFDKLVYDEDSNVWVESTSANIGDLIDFKIEFEATNYAGDEMIRYYVIRDEKDSALWVEFNDISITVGNKQLEKGYYWCAGDPSIDTLDWTAAEDPTRWAATPAEADWYLIHYSFDEFEIVIPWASDCTFSGVANADPGYVLSFGDDADSKFDSPASVTVAYSASVGPDAAKTTVENSATLTWFINAETPDGPEYPQKTETTVYNLGITKTDATGKVLAGATFELYKDKAYTQPVYIIKTNNEDVYILDDFMTSISGANRTTSREKYAGYWESYIGTKNGRNDMTTHDSGQLVILGLESGTYYLKETVAPAGYNQLPDPVEVVVGSGTQTDVYDNGYKNLDGTDISYNVYSIPIVNNQGVELPSTGGTGTMLLITIGTMVAMAFAVLLITHKKMSVYHD